MATIRFQRKNEYLNRIRDYLLFVDDQEIGTIANDEIKEFEIEPGQYSVIAKIDWCRSSKRTFDIKENDIKTIQIGCFKNADKIAKLAFATMLFELILTNLSPYLLLLLAPFFLIFLYYFTIGYDKYLVLKETETDTPITSNDHTESVKQESHLNSSAKIH